jgi:hypothetical protein
MRDVLLPLRDLSARGRTSATIHNQVVNSIRRCAGNEKSAFALVRAGADIYRDSP